MKSMYQSIKAVVLAVLFIVTFTSNAQEVTTPRVDQRMELLSIVFRLAEVSEFSEPNNLPYLAKVEKWFAPYKEHSVVQYTKFLKETQGIEKGMAHSAIPDLAIRLNIKKGKVSLNKDLSFDDLDDRWVPDSLPKYIKLLNDFYKKSKFETFFNSNTQYYYGVEERFKTQVSDKIDFQWFNDFFGDNDFSFESNMIISLLTGSNNYGASAYSKDGKKHIYSVNGFGYTDSLDLPMFSPQFHNVVVHEFCHSFCNPIIDRYLDQLYPQAEKFYKSYEYKMKMQSYGSVEHYLSEIFVRACTMHYMSRQAEDREERLDIIFEDMQLEKYYGFLWIDSLYNILEYYQHNRQIYKNIDSFMPEIVNLQNRLNPEEIYQTFESRRATILGTNIENGSQDVDYNLDSIVVYFDIPMAVYNSGASYDMECKECKKWNSSSKKNYWSKDAKSWIFFIGLEPDSEYSMIFPDIFFMTSHKNPEGYWEIYRPKNTYRLRFKTRKKQ